MADNVETLFFKHQGHQCVKKTEKDGDLHVEIRVVRTDDCVRKGMIREGESIISNAFLTVSEKLTTGKEVSVTTVRR